ncbi:MAG: SAM-dependent methyltransferase [Nitrospirota bacterium]|nr:SAM-dependent methyltransferase [Nitrospirota bacterium]
MTDPVPQAQGELAERIRAEIRAHGPMPFATFMARALYTPDLGYYTGPREKIGTGGDFFTSLDVHPAFGQLIGAQLIEMADRLPDGPFTVVEMGAGKGLLAHDVLRTVQAARPDLFARLTYAIVDVSPDLIARQKQVLAGFAAHTRWYADLEQVPRVTGVFLSNELLDSLPHHQVVMTADGLREVFVEVRGDGFGEVLREPSDVRLNRVFERLGITLPEGYRTEVNLAAEEWARQVSERLSIGYVLTIDYGYPADVYYRSDRRTGTFLCYHRHKVSEDPYSRVGEQDMTAHVDFSSVARAGEDAGLEVEGFTDQAHFLVGMGITRLMERVLARDGGDPENSAEFQAMRKLMDPHGMGKAFKVLVQRKQVPAGGLSGVRFKAFDVSDLLGTTPR